MGDEVFFQGAFDMILSDIESETLPGAILISGPEFSGKLTAALEVARILSCTGDRSKSCLCESCRKNRTLSAENVLVAGPRDCMMEILAGRRALLDGYPPHIFERAVKKLTCRFSEVLWEESDKFPKIAPVLGEVFESLEKISANSVSEVDSAKVEKAADSVVKNCEKLSDFLYDSLPIEQVRNASTWLRIRSGGGKKVFVIENAQRMLEGARNALLKILEEPPTDAVFVLTAPNVGAIMQTILSRVRVYGFVERSEIQQREVLLRVFRNSEFSRISDFLYSFLPKTPAEVRREAVEFCRTIRSGGIPSVEAVVKSCASFEPRTLLRFFLEGVLEASGDFCASSAAAYVSGRNLKSVQACFDSVSTYNQGVQAALERLLRDLALNFRMAG